MTETKHTRVAVLMGGWSSEREVSLKSGEGIVAALRRQNYDVLAVDPAKDLIRFAAQIAAARPDVIFNALHGTGGEDGIIQGALEMSGIPYTHSDVRASAMAMDKKITKIIAQTIGIGVTEDKIVQRRELANGHPIQPPYVVKPLNEGSSVGVSIVQNDADQALQGDPEQWVMVEKYIPGMELTVGVLDVQDGSQSRPEALGITNLQPKTGFYDYKAKYTDGVTEHFVNPELPAGVAEQAKQASIALHHALGCRDVSRSDFRYNPEDGLVLLEINTHPGMTSLSLVPEQAAAKGIDFDTLVVTLIEAALRRTVRSTESLAA